MILSKIEKFGAVLYNEIDMKWEKKNIDIKKIMGYWGSYC
jgi:hypothetical protein